ncbi:p53 and DNA damage-regulated protein 1-like isoform X1 [Macrobrachium nipponense]|uniref:p53 and DNA damage-regulated protein 1-like isoform X1 n=2 Tax=Macrobrachium nipponense TaxID=159736 RepID=UPI0030C86BEC
MKIFKVVTMAQSVERIQQYLIEVEEAAEDIISDQQEIISLDRRRNTNREALRQLQTKSTGNQTSAEKNWICIGNMFMRLPKPFIAESIEREQKQLDTEIKNLRNGLRNKVNHLNDLEDKQETIGTNIKPLSQEEWKAVRKALGN